MYRKILVPLDGSKRAEVILKHVESIAHCYKAEVIFFGVVEAEPVVIAPGTVYPALDQQAHDQRVDEMGRYLVRIMESFQERSISVRMILAHGAVVDRIIATADDENVDLIAMASHGRTGLSRVFFGSVAAGVLNRIDRPLLLIRSPGFE